jgi:AcrR family transcriptional regulator
VRPDQILDAAQSVLLTDGAVGLTMDAVATKAGIGKGTIYHYYRSKSDILSALRARYLARITAHADAAARRVRTRAPAVRIERFFAALLESTVDNGELVWILFHQTAVEEENELAGISDALFSLIRDEIAAGRLSLSDPEFTATFMLHGFHGSVEAAFHRGDFDPDELSRRLRATVRTLLSEPG